MDAKITKKRLTHMLSYDWVKIIAAVAVAVLVWSLIFTMTATRITNTQRFVVCNYLGLNFGKQGGSVEHSYEILEAERVDNMRGGEDMFGQLFQANLEIGEGDVMLVSDYSISREVKKDDNGNEIKDSEDNPVYEYSEETGFYECLVNLDEDEMAHFLGGSFHHCPYFSLEGEYRTVRKQN
jgi:hypothetical protein